MPNQNLKAAETKQKKGPLAPNHGPLSPSYPFPWFLLQIQTGGRKRDVSRSLGCKPQIHPSPRREAFTLLPSTTRSASRCPLLHPAPPHFLPSLLPSPQGSSAGSPSPTSPLTMNAGGRRRYTSEQLLFDVPANAATAGGAGRWTQVRTMIPRDLRAARDLRLAHELGFGVILRAARWAAPRGRGDLRVGGPGDAGTAARRGRGGCGVSGAETSAQPRAARSPCL